MFPAIVIVMIYQGRVVAKGSPDELKERTGTTNLRETFLKLIEDVTDMQGGQL